MSRAHGMFFSYHLDVFFYVFDAVVGSAGREGGLLQMLHGAG